jgi:predicted nucleic acid-binding protein
VTTAIVCDPSALVVALVDAGPAGGWAARELSGGHLAAPQLLAFECSNILRRHELAGLLSADQAAQAHRDLLDLEVEQWPYELLSERVWELRANLTSYEASYVAVAELAQAPLVTLDRRLSRAPGLRCTVRTP